jgi:NAD(P)-dependent dehydrogenase (short-subunit alcohol dehydrogenase family)
MKIEELFCVRDKIVLITGGSRGLGEMIARAYVGNGAKVYISARNGRCVGTWRRTFHDRRMRRRAALCCKS